MRLGPAEIRWTTTDDGDFVRLGDGDPDVDRRRRAVADMPWAWVRQVHGAEVVTVDGEFRRPAEEADALVTATPRVALAIRTADCGPLALASPEGVIGAAHAGWRGLVSGVIERTAAAMRALGATDIQAALGPCIGAECYEFGGDELRALVERYGPEVGARTSDGTPALDVRAAVRAAAHDAGVELVHVDATCTACSPAHWSYRGAKDAERQAMAVWLP